MVTRIRKWGNSLALRIPKCFALEVGLEQGKPVEVSMEKGKLVIKPVAKPRFSLKDLLAKVSTRNLHREVETGPALGKEIW
jgi:antitoxin MazE